MKEFFESIFKTTEERLKNPFIGAFSTAWLLFNWKSVLLLVLSAKLIEEKIIIIDKNLSNIWTAFVLPLLSALFYTSVLPYINLGIDETLKFSINRRTLNLINKKIKNIDNQKLIAIKEIEIEDAKIEYREKRQQNNLIEDLQKKLVQAEDTISSIRQSHSSETDTLKNIIKDLEESRSTDLIDSERKIANLREERESLTSSINSSNEVIGRIQKDYENNSTELAQTLDHLEKTKNELSLLENKLGEQDNLINNLHSKIDSINKQKRVIYKFDGGLELYESKDGNNTIYVDRRRQKVYSVDEFNEFKKTRNLEKFIE